MVKRLPAMRETRFDPWVGKIPWRRKWQPTPILLPGKSHGQRSLIGYSPWGHKELDTTERLHFTSLPHCRQMLYCLSYQGSPNQIMVIINFTLYPLFSYNVSARQHWYCTSRCLKLSGIGVRVALSIPISLALPTGLWDSQPDANLVCSTECILKSGKLLLIFFIYSGVMLRNSKLHSQLYLLKQNTLLRLQFMFTWSDQRTS